MRDFAQVVKDTFESVVMLELYAMSQVDISIVVLQNDGAYKSAAINAATLALVDAGISMKHLLVSATGGFVEGNCCLDLLYAEEKREACCAMIAYAPAKNLLAHLNVISPKMSTPALSASIEMAIGGCQTLYSQFRSYIQEYMATHYHKGD